MELNDLVLIGLVSVTISAIIGVLIAWIARGIRERDVGRLEMRVESLEMSRKGDLGNSKRAEKAERMQMAMVEVAAIMKNPEIADKQGAIMQLAMKYPDIAMDLLKKGI